MSDTDDVLRRWNPRGWVRLHRSSVPEPGGAVVRVAGVAGSGRTTLTAELTELGDVVYIEDGDAPVVLMVLDASSVLGRTELAVLDAAARGAAEVVFAFTGIDRYPRWRSISDRDIELLHRHALWLTRVVVIPVSAVAAARARELGGDAGRVLALESGIVGVHEALLAAVAASAPGRAMRAAVVAQTRSMIVDEIAVLAAADDTAELRAERERLATRPVGAEPRPDFHRARVELMQELAVRVREASVVLRDVLDEGSADPGSVEILLTAHSQRLRDEVAAAVERRLGAVAQPPSAEPAPVPQVPGRRLDDRLALLLGASAGAGLGRMAATMLGAIPVAVSVLVTVVCGAVAAWWLVRLRRQLARRELMRRWVVDELTSLRADLEAWVRTMAFDAESKLGHDAVARERARATDLHERVAAIDERIRRRIGEQRARIAACERDLARLNPVER
ncbi:hypothetical protein EV641_113124 [Rhodococcus sp. SMB37]|uniref:hypothetical protein n=1 Tax=Rhodococcus sp. SMB37 TaxID=2512213 RepID=UPI001048239F|nr:hypothetical protein [Rhodococcus sp. SMB37]TCN50143.1 hypothetical protein EV641_113124 [Rhodococcus sp. SMB37]